MPIDEFLKNYWQKKPLLIRQAFPNFQSPIDANELAGLAMEDFVESRLVRSEGWQLEHGPFTEQQLTQLPEKDCTLLVQGVDQLVPEIADLLENFRFLPSWRLDDIMVSYATDGGSVGPHFDHYDVFLLQADGLRRWKVGQTCDANSKLLEGSLLAILDDFSPTEEWLLEPGDMLYLPPNLAHWGVAEGECLTFSIGFRAPNTQELISNFCGDRLASDFANQYFSDEVLNLDKPCLIGDDVLAQARRLMMEVLDDKEALSNWFGRYMTSQRYTELDEENDTPKRQSVGKYCINPSARIAFIQNQNETQLFANGEAFKATEQLAETICQREDIDISFLNQLAKENQDEDIVQKLIQMNVLQPQE